jgi:hypothetical protein
MKIPKWEADFFIKVLKADGLFKKEICPLNLGDHSFNIDTLKCDCGETLRGFEEKVKSSKK